ncbi:hypothetical protein AQJ43_17520 [Streptomyces avermitilis]|nr:MULTISPECIES: hypothetical protein [Streptomyces]KUN53899.1 hypothetical protein AQJ43_17520 [Streptomyces avermitilis]MYT02080.1 hypothetical protein [Streptomyces sp. SID5469]OOV30014.1 hypothetical protein SM007_17700 [Streptomyces avermitilis]BBJ54793.1 hypothetical protein SAVMC3_74220 [Streptomyces avermitilis]GDY66784.1 hypothetical protein SAV14893_061770 [Streptomyces avermitilis]
MTLAERTTGRHPDEETAPPPRADCIADSAGGLTFDIGGSDEAGLAHLVLRRREDDAEVRLPLTPSAEGRLRAALPSSVELPEGRWDAYAQTADGEPQRLVPGVSDLRSLVDRGPGAAGHVAVRIPYATKHGNLTVRSWLRAPHAEAGELRIGDGGLQVSGRVHGAALAPGAHAELCRRGEPASVLTAEVAPRQGEFRFTVDYGAMAEGVWDLWLRPAGEDGPRVRIARLLDDIADKKPIFTYPKLTLETKHGPVQAGPYYTADNELSVTVTSAPPPQ